MSIKPTQNKVITSDSLEYLKLFNDYQADILFCDPPYALGSEVIIRQDGSGSEIIGGQKANFRNWFACEKNDNYTKIANERIKHFEEYDYKQLSLFDE